MNDFDESGLSDILARRRSGPADILHTLLDIQTSLGSVPVAALPRIAKALEVTEAALAGVLSYYPELRVAEPGRHRIRVCLGESCLANRGNRLLTTVQDELKIKAGETTPDGRFTLDPISCVGNCAVGPSLVIDQDVYGRVTAHDVPRLIEPYR